MNYDEFKQELRKQILDNLAGSDRQVTDRVIPKNNGLMRDAFYISLPGSEIAPTMYYRAMFEEYCAGATVQQLASDALKIADESIAVKFSFRDLDSDYVKKNAFVVVVNAAANEQMLKTCPHKLLAGGLAVCAKFHVDIGLDNKGTIQVNNELLSHLKLTKDEVLDWAISNTSKEQFFCKNLGSFIKDMLFEGADEIADPSEFEEISAYVLMLPGGSYGAAALACNDVLERTMEQVGEDCYILPSSLHELLLIPKSTGFSVEELQEMVESVNSSQLLPEEILSNRVFEYDSAHRKLLVAGECETELENLTMKHNRSLKM